MEKKETKTMVKKRKKNINVAENRGDSESVIIEDGVVYKAPRIIKEKEKAEKPAKQKKRKGEKDAVARINATSKTGLTTEQVEKRIAEGHVNVVENKNVKSYAQIFLSNIFTFFNILCFAIAIALICVGAPISMLIFMITILGNLVIGIIQEIKAKKTIEKISLVVSPSATVIRNKEEVEILINEIVIDDNYPIEFLRDDLDF